VFLSHSSDITVHGKQICMTKGSVFMSSCSIYSTSKNNYRETGVRLQGSYPMKDFYVCQYEDLVPIEGRRSWVFLTKFIFIDNLY